MFCYCGSAQDFILCCLPFISGKQKPATPEQLMRSRYSAYCNADVEYIHQTYHPDKQAENPAVEIAAFAHSAHFIALTVLAAPALLGTTNAHPLQLTTQQIAQQITTENQAEAEHNMLIGSALSDGSFGYVHFVAHFIQQDKLHLLEEMSRFVWQQQQWWYLDGRLLPKPVCKINRNDSCPCGSGKKYKVCQPHLPSGQKR